MTRRSQATGPGWLVGLLVTNLSRDALWFTQGASHCLKLARESLFGCRPRIFCGFWLMVWACWKFRSSERAAGVDRLSGASIVSNGLECKNFAWCKTYLSGRQRIWCSDACRKSFERRRERGQSLTRRLSGKLSGLGQFPIESEVEMRLFIRSRAIYLGLKLDRQQVASLTRVVLLDQNTLKWLQNELERRVPGYEFIVTVTTLR